MKTALFLLAASSLVAAEPIDIASRWELFVDEFLVAQKNGITHKLHDPIKREIVLTTGLGNRQA